MSFHVPEKWRVRSGAMGSDSSYGNNGTFIIPAHEAPRNTRLIIIASDGMPEPDKPWEHVSVSTAKRAPYWEEMCFVKNLFWDSEDAVVQFHPPESDWINNHPYCLHLWRPVGIEIPRPPRIAV